MSYADFIPYLDLHFRPLMLFCMTASIVTVAAAKFARKTSKGKKEIAITEYNLELAKFYATVFPAIPVMMQVLTWSILGK
jgi:hypothetical protein